MGLLEPLLFVRYHILVILLDMMFGSFHIWASIDYSYKQTLVFNVDSSSLLLLDLKSRWPMIELLRFVLVFRQG